MQMFKDAEFLRKVFFSGKEDGCFFPFPDSGVDTAKAVGDSVLLAGSGDIPNAAFNLIHMST